MIGRCSRSRAIRKQNSKPVSVAHEVDLTVQTEVMTAGYSSRRPHKMSADKDCRIIASSSDEKILFDTCNTLTASRAALFWP